MFGSMTMRLMVTEDESALGGTGDAGDYFPGRYFAPRFFAVRYFG